MQDYGNSKKTKYIVGIGGATMDVHCRSLEEVRLRNSNPSTIHTSAGGVTRNIIENLARQGERTVFLSALGDDAFGQAIIDASEAAGINMSQVHISREKPTACYLAMLDDAGDMLIGASDLAVLDELGREYFQSKKELIRGASAIVTDTNFTTAQLEEILDAAGNVPVFIDPVSAAKAVRICSIAGRFYMIKPNIFELELLTGMKCGSDEEIRLACDSLIAKGCKAVAVSLGERGCYYADSEGRSMFRKLTKIAVMKDATGAGDAFTAGFVNGFVNGLSAEKTLDLALASGLIAVESEDTINTNMSSQLVRETAEKYAQKGE